MSYDYNNGLSQGFVYVVLAGVLTLPGVIQGFVLVIDVKTDK